MMVGKRILAGVILVLSTAMLLIMLAGSVGVWIVKEPVTDKATEVFQRIEAALDLAEQKLGLVKTTLARATERLDSARQEQRQLSQDPARNNIARRLLARKIQNLIAPQFVDANEKLHTVAEAAVVVNSVLEDVGNIPFLGTTGLDLDRLAQMNSRLAEVGPTAWELSRLLGEPEPNADAAGNQFSKIDHTLTTLREFLAEFEARLTQVRQQAAEVKSKTLSWITPAAILISVVCFWIALSQVCLMVRCWSWWRHSPHDHSSPVPRR